MATILSYASPERRTWRGYVGLVAIAVAVCSSVLVVAATFYTRYRLVSYVRGGWCGSPHAALRAQLYELPAILFVPGIVAAGVADQLRYRERVARVSVWTAILGWVICVAVN